MALARLAIVIAVLGAGTAASWADYQQADDPLTPPLATSGLRASVSVGIASPTGDFSTADLIRRSLFVSGRFGSEILLGNTAVTPAIRVDFASWRNNFDELLGQEVRLLHFLFAGELRGAVHVGRFALYAALATGLEFDTNNVDGERDSLGLGIIATLGADVITSPGLGAGLALSLHPGFTPVSPADDVNTAFMAIAVTVSWLQHKK